MTEIDNRTREIIMGKLIKAYRKVIFAEKRREMCGADLFLACDRQLNGAVDTFYSMVDIVWDIYGEGVAKPMRQEAIMKATELGEWVQGCD